MTDTVAELARAREAFLTLVDDVRPELHRYAARLTGSVIDGEDIVQESLAKALYALSQMPEPPPLRPWLFRITHNTALDFLKAHGRKLTEPRADLTDVADLGAADAAPDPSIVRAALALFLTLPTSQRSAVILKDVLDHSLEETAETMGTTIMSVKALLVRGRAALRSAAPDEDRWKAEAREKLEQYATLFNARDWDGVRALIADDCQLDLVSKTQRRGKQVGMYFARYEKEDVRLQPGELEGRLVLAAFVGAATTPSYFVLLSWEGDRVGGIRDFRYVPYIAREAAFRPLT
ncbi:MAG: sigma-70 family RNA polymerase sigma factor [Polyangiaceae bacterium]